MDQSFLQGISTIFVMIAFAGVCWWAFSPKRKKKFEEAANLPFADEPSQEKQNAEKQNLHSEKSEEGQG